MPILEGALAVALVVWCALGIFHLWNARGLTALGPGMAGDLPVPAALEAPASASAPRVSIIVAARNEQEMLPATLASLAGLDYPDYEVILVDDDSTDRTGAIADQWAASPESAGRRRVIHNHALPAGWRGKVHALDLAARAATGDWLLSTDADVVFHPDALRLAMAVALGDGAQLFSMMPEFEYGSFGEKAILPAFSFLLATLFPVRLVNNPRSRRAIAAGAFILMRRADFDELGGYSSLRGTLIEDLRTAQMFKQSGRHIRAAVSRGLLRTRMYASLRELWEGLRRSAFEGSGRSVPKVLAGLAGGNLLGVLPWAAAASLLAADLEARRALASDRALLLAMAACVVSVLVYLPFLVFLRVPPLYVLALPLATLCYSGIALDSMVSSRFGGGVTWKDRTYTAPDDGR
ncbi:MAG TPA: glycosyltransferase family 2 protein [Terriglobia bacterium]|nr:glycosyltransferase family 2 protein [Terriglobia bacterium]